MSAIHTEIGFDLRSVKHYSTAARAVAAVEKATEGMRARGVVFNLLIVEQTDAIPHRGTRFIPILNCWRVPKSGPTEITYMGVMARYGFVCFA